ncbi:MAG TPA: hypothetical protein VGI40_28605 [Pirellulaceae bacterium]
MALQIAVALAAASCFAADNQSKSKSQIIAQPAAKSQRPPARKATATERLLLDARDGRLDDFSFLTAALTASGMETADEAQKWLAMYKPVRAGIVAQLPAGTTTDRLKAIHAAAYRFVLTGAYQESCSDLRETFTSGSFNCLTSLAVCFDLSRAAGINAQPVLIRGHVSLAYSGANNQALIFEPGAADWHAREFADQSASRVLSPIELLGKFYYNRGIELLRAGGYQEGVSLLRTSLALDPSDDDTRANLVAGLNNWAVEECQGGRYGEAASLIERGLALDPTFAPLVANEKFVRTKLSK